MGTAKSTTAPFGVDTATLKDRVSEKVSDAKITVEEKARYASAKVTDGLSVVGNKMQEKPLAAMGIALGVGFILGRLMAR